MPLDLTTAARGTGAGTRNLRTGATFPVRQRNGIAVQPLPSLFSRVIAAALTRKRAQGERGLSDRIDAVLTNKYLAIPVFLLIMFGIFLLTFSSVGAWMSDIVEQLIGGVLAPWLSTWLTGIGTSPWLVSLISDGIIGGVGGVLTFLPQIALLFFCLSLLEDSGYLSRTAFIMDKLLRSFGLSANPSIPC